MGLYGQKDALDSSKVHEKVISFTRHTPSSGISSGSRCPAQMLNKWDPCPVSFLGFF